VPAFVELRSRPDARPVLLDGDRRTVGRDASNDIALPEDPRASRIHAALERYGSGWCLHDLGSRNGTFVNGQRLWRERVLHDGDEIRIGNAHLVYRTRSGPDRPDLTEGGAGVLRLTPREFDVLAALCSPVLAGSLFTEPASTREIARMLVVTQAAVKQHLGRLYDKLGIDATDPERRRARLANEAVSRGVLSLADLRTWAAQHRPGTAEPPPAPGEADPGPGR
jgi:DNA-binding transcriptional ArsR family regulator